MGMDLGIDIRRRPEPMMHLSLEIYAPGDVRRVRRHLEVAVFEEKVPHLLPAMARLQRSRPAQISSTLRRNHHLPIDVVRKGVDCLQIPLEVSAVKPQKGNC